MGFQVSTLYNVPSGKIKYFIYVLERNSNYKEWLDDNFNNLVDQLDSNSGIVRGTDESFTYEVFKFLNEHSSNNQFCTLEYLFINAVSLLISEGPIHKNGNKIFLIPLSFNNEPDQTEKEFIKAIFDNVILACTDGTIEQLTESMDVKSVSMRKSFKRIIITRLKTINYVLELKPNFNGLGVNLNAAIDKFIQRLEED